MIICKAGLTVSFNATRSKQDTHYSLSSEAVNTVKQVVLTLRLSEDNHLQRHPETSNEKLSLLTLLQSLVFHFQAEMLSGAFQENLNTSFSF